MLYFVIFCHILIDKIALCMGTGAEYAFFNKTSKGGIELAVNSQDKQKELQNVTICVKFQLSDGKSHCLFDVASLQFLYSHPSDPGYGILKIKTGHERTVVFSPPGTFQVSKMYQVCLKIVLKSAKSNVAIFWDGKRILNEVKVGASAIKGPLLIKSKQLLGVCNQKDDFLVQSPMPVGMRGVMADFRLWPMALDDGLLKRLTKDCSIPLESLPNTTLHQGRLSKIGKDVSIYSTTEFNVCKYKDVKTQMFFKLNENFMYHERECHFFGGEMFLPNATIDFTYFAKYIAQAKDFAHVIGNDKCYRFWIPLGKVGIDEDLHWVTGADFNATYLPFSPGEPNGGNFQQCVVVEANTNQSTLSQSSKYFDQDCKRDHACSLCIIPQARKFTLRGLPNAFDVDTEYILNTQISNPLTEEISFLGLTKSEAIYNKKNGKFIVKTNDKKMIQTRTATVHGVIDNATLMRWPTKTKETHGVLFKFTSCDARRQFTCANGACIDLLKRCDDQNDCIDGSDENDCTVVFFDQSQYRKSNKPKPGYGKDKLNVDINFYVQRIDSIQELKSTYQIRVMVMARWRDGRLRFLNLRSGLSANIIDDETARSLWIPPLEIPEALTECHFEYDKVSSLQVAKQSEGNANGIEHLHEGMEFDGSVIPLMLTKQLQLKHSCMFRLENYPFDVQLCKMKVQIQEMATKNITLVVTKNLKQITERMEDSDTTQFELGKLSVEVIDNTSVALLIPLRRIYHYHIASTFFPTASLLIISCLTLFINPERFEAKIGLSLTTMLVMQTLQENIGSNLPKTAYIKLIDEWLIFGMCVPFVVFLALVFIEILPEDGTYNESDPATLLKVSKSRKIPPMTKITKDKMHKLFQLIIPSMTILAALTYLVRVTHKIYRERNDNFY